MPHKAEMHEASKLIPEHFADNIREMNDVKMNENDMTNEVRKGQARSKSMKAVQTVLLIKMGRNVE